MSGDLIARGVELAKRGGGLAWDWARWAYESAGPIGEGRINTGATARLATDREQVAASLRGDAVVPEVKTLLGYRQAAEALPDREREEQISVSVARELYAAGLGPVDRERVLASFNGDPITRAAVRERVAEFKTADAPPPPPPPPPPPEPAPDDTEPDSDEPEHPDDESEPEPKPKPKAPATFNRVNDNIGWANWSWNPVTGCLHNCDYCYARDIADRFYPQGFAPTFLSERLEAPQHTPIPADPDPAARRVFTCSMADLFGKWVPQEWIDAVFAQIVAAPQWEFLCLTKFPQRLAELDWPDNVWAGTTVDKQHRVAVAERSFAEVKAGVKWLSCEPLLEPLTFDSLEMFDWVVIGASTGSRFARPFAPPFDWVADLRQQALAAGCKVYLKHNLFASKDGVGPGMEPVREWPR